MSVRLLRALLVFMGLLSVMPLPSSALVHDDTCTLKCYRSVDTAQCVNGRLGGRSCDVYSECITYAIDPDGPGGAPPSIMVTCSYNCRIDYCVWV